MKKLTNSLLIVTIFVLMGCSDSNKTPKKEEPQALNKVDIKVPEKLDPEGRFIDISEYFFPIDNGTTIKNYTLTTQDANRSVALSQMNITRTIVKDTNRSIVQQESKIIISNRINKYHIIELKVIENGTKITRYPRSLRVNSDLFREEDGSDACVLREKLDSFDLDELLPSEANPNDTKIEYDNVLHFHCGTNKRVIDKYYAYGLGEVVEIYNYSDGKTQYLVLKK